ncbi:MAG: Abi family protein [Candidatus Saccharibacteria bacterium]|nr:Abi family protein [Candidatus Saccharibacteria bacterium]
MLKPFKTIEEQIKLLESRGLTIEDRSTAESFLLENNYYRISGYSLTLRTNDMFHEGATFDNIIDIYDFDHELRHILLKYTEIIEVKLKSIFAYKFSEKYGSTGYLNPSNFTDPIKYQEIFLKSEKLKVQRLPHEAYLKHFINDLQENVPLWAYVDLFSISDISLLYKISTDDIKKSIVPAFCIEEHKYKLLENFMHSITILRNLCAHDSRLYNRLFEQKPKLSTEEKRLLLVKEDGSIDNEHLFSFILILRRLLNKSQFESMLNEIASLNQKINFVDMRYYGFPENWQEFLSFADDVSKEGIENE